MGRPVARDTSPSGSGANGRSASTLVVGVGTGRCGTTSLAALLDRLGWVTHERFGPRVRWGSLPGEWARRLWTESRLDAHASGARVVGDVALYWLPALEWFLRMGDAAGVPVRVVGVQRGRDDTADSFARWLSPQTDHWAGPGTDRHRTRRPHAWDASFPVAPGPTRADSIRAYWSAYYNRLRAIERADDRVKVFPVDALNDPDEIGRLFEHVRPSVGPDIDHTPVRKNTTRAV